MEQHANDPAPLPAELAAVWGAFLHEGLMVSIANPQRPVQILDRWSQGCIELIIEACNVLNQIWEQVRERWYSPQGFPGVFEYEVVSEVGRRMGDHLLITGGDLPDPDTLESLVRELIRQFYAQGEDRD